MKLPSLPYSDSRMKRAMLQFGGVDYTPGAQAGQWEETENVSCLEYPALVPRMGRMFRYFYGGGNTTAIYAYGGKIARVTGTGFYYDSVKICDVSPGRKQMCVVGKYLVIWPDQIYYDLEDGSYGTAEEPILIPGSTGVNVPAGTPKRLYLPASGWGYAPEEDGVPISGKGDVAAVNPTIPVHTKTAHSDTWTNTYFNMVRRGQEVKVPDVGGVDRIFYVKSTSTENREYWPGVSRGYVTLTLGDEYGVEAATISGWAYAQNTAPYLPGDSDKIDVYTLGWADGAETAVAHSKRYNELEIGDIVRYSAGVSGHSYEVVTYIDRTLYTDHYYYTEIRTCKYTGTEITYEADVSDYMGEMAQNTKVRLTAGDTVIETTYVGADDENRYLEFDDNIRAIAGKGDITIQYAFERPELEYICSHENRLWGVAGGKIYASAWGDPTTFDSETQTQADPWNTEVSEDGDWTGVVSYSGALYAFKEHMVYKVIGTLPENYTVYAYHIEGIRKGCHKSAVIIGEVLYYLGPNGVYAYAGSTPQRISSNFDIRVYEDGVAGTDGMRYYLSARYGNAWDLHVLDTEKGIWLREDDTQVIDFAQYGGKLYALDSFGTYRQYGCRRDGSDTYIDHMPDYEVVTPIKWHAVTARLYEDVQTQYVSMPIEHHSYSKLVIRVELEAGSRFGVEISYDGGDFEPCYMQLASRRQTYIVPIIPRRCEQMRIRLYGEGWFRLRGIVRVMHGGSAL